MVEPQHAVSGCRRRLGVRDQHAGGASAVDLAREQLQHDIGGVRIEIAGRLVGQHERRPVHQRARDRDALQFAAGKLTWHARLASGQPDFVEQRSRARVPLVRSDAEQHQRQRNVLHDRQVRQDVESLEHEAELRSSQQRARGVFEPRDVGAFDLDSAGLRAVESGDQVEQRRLAGTGFADDRDVFAAADVERERVEHGPRHRSAWSARRSAASRRFYGSCRRVRAVAPGVRGYNRGPCPASRARVERPCHVESIRVAAERLRGHIEKTPCVHSRTLSQITGARGLPQVREPAVHRLVQGTRRAEQAVIADARAEGAAA